jgi:hypothetical protein
MYVVYLSFAGISKCEPSRDKKYPVRSAGEAEVQIGFLASTAAGSKTFTDIMAGIGYS